MKKTLLFFATCMLSLSGYCTNYYVSSLLGNNSNPGTQAAPFATIQRAANLTNPGDVVYIMNGTYTSTTDYIPVLKISRPGTASAHIVYTNFPGHTPILKTAATGNWSVIKCISQKVGSTLYTPAYIDIIGLTVQGNRTSVVNPTCTNAISYTNGSGLLITGPFAWDGADQPYNGLPASSKNLATARAYVPHHITVKNCKVFDCTSSGIAAQRCDFVTIEGNEVYDNCWYTKDGTSGINMYEAVQYSADSSLYSSGYQVIINNNRVYGNKLTIPQQCSAFYDGNGIIVDDYKLEQNNDGINPYLGHPYIGKTLIANNLLYNNGGSGAHIYLSQNIDILNNSTYKNITVNPGNGEIYIVACKNVTARNNSMYASPNKTVLALGSNTNVNVSNNIGFPATTASGVRVVDPLYVSPNLTPTANFSLQPTSSAINQGMNLSAVTTDFTYANRTDGRIDIGAYEFVPDNIGKALRFDGNDAVSLAPSTGMNTGTGNFTYEARIKASTTQNVSYPTIVSTRDENGQGATLFLAPGTYGWEQGKPWVNINHVNYPCSTCPSLTDNQCHHVAVTRAGDVLNFYVDGVLYLTRPIVESNDITTTGGVRIGHDLGNPTETYFNGEISEVRLWNVDRSSQEINTYATKSVSGSAFGLVNYWRLNEGSGQMTYNTAASSQNHGILGSTTTAETSDPAWVTSCTSIQKKYGSACELAIDLGTLTQGAVYPTQTDNNATSNGFDDDYGQVSDDIFYKFTITQPSKVTISHCQSNGLDTYLHLLGSNRQLIKSLDDYGPVCSSSRSSSISENLSAGTYYFISEGYSSITGNIISEIKVEAATGTPVARIAADNETTSILKSIDQPQVYPNPIQSGTLYFNRKATVYTLYTLLGSVVASGKNASKLSIQGLQKGIYMLKMDNATEKIIIE